MFSLFSAILARAALGQKGYQCPDGTYRDVELEYVHVQDFSEDFYPLRYETAYQLRSAIHKLDQAFGGQAKFSVVSAVDKNSTKHDFNCDEVVPPGLVNWSWALDGIIQGYFIDSLKYGANHARPDMFDAVIRQLNDWAGRGEAVNPQTGAPIVRLVSIGTDQCSRVSGRNYNLDSELVKSWETDRKLSFPLTGSPLASCQQRDFPTLEEVAQEANLNDARMVFLVSPEDAYCEDHEQYDDAVSQLTVVDWYKRAESIFQDHGVYVHSELDVAEDMSDLEARIMASVEDVVCNTTTQPSITTTTTEPTTTADHVGPVTAPTQNQD